MAQWFFKRNRKNSKVAVVAEGDKAKEAEEAGADFVGSDELIQKIQGGWFDFDVLIATPNMMGKLGRLGRILGPKGLMPNPKTGTVTMDIANAVNEVKKVRSHTVSTKKETSTC